MSTAVGCPTNEAFLNHIKITDSLDFDNRFRLIKEQNGEIREQNALVFFDLPQDLAERLNDVTGRKPQPPIGERRKIYMLDDADDVLYIPGNLFVGVCRTGGKITLFEPPTENNVRKFRESFPSDVEAAPEPRRPAAGRVPIPGAPSSGSLHVCDVF